MAKKITVVGYKAFKKVVENYQKADLVYCYFSASKDKDGKSWCQICFSAEPFVIAALEKYARKDAVFIHTEVGESKEWKDIQNPFRRDNDIRLTNLPTILRWKYQWRLESTLCTKDDILKMFFTEHEE